MDIVRKTATQNQTLPERWKAALENEEKRQPPPVEDAERQPQDGHCFWIFVGICVVMATLSIVLLAIGNIGQLFTPFDSDGRECGVEVAGYPYLYYPSPSDLSRSVCVASCPSDEGLPLDCSPNSVIGACTRDLRDHFNLSNQVMVYESELHFGRVCLPTAAHLGDIVNASVNFQELSVLEAIRKLWPLLLVIPVINILLNLTFYYLLHKWPAAVLGVLVLLWFGSLLAFLLMNVFAPKDFMVIAYIVVAGVALLVTARFLCSNHGFRRVVQEVVQFATDQVFTHKWVMFVHPARALLELLYLAAWLLILFAIVSLGSSNSESARHSFMHFDFNPAVVLLVALHLFMFFWVYGVLNNLAAYLISASAVTWYFQPDSDHSSFPTVARRLWLFHRGSVCLAGTLVTFFGWFFDLLLSIVPYRTVEGCQACCTRGYLTCCGCCLDRVYSLVKSNAHSLMYMYGLSFFEGSHMTHVLLFDSDKWNEFEITLNNFYWMIRLELCLISSQICYAIIRGVYGYDGEVTGFLLLVFLSTYVLGAFLIQTLSAISTGIIISDLISERLRLPVKRDLSFAMEYDKIKHFEHFAVLAAK